MKNLIPLIVLAAVILLAITLFVPIPEYHQKAYCSLPADGFMAGPGCGAEGWYLGPSIWMKVASLWNIKQPVSRLDSPKSKYSCKVNADCALGIRLDSCCSCPEPVSRGFINGETWKVYNEKEDYYPQREKKSASCRNAACQPCPPLLSPVCSYNVCQFNIGGTN